MFVAATLLLAAHSCGAWFASWPQKVPLVLSATIDLEQTLELDPSTPPTGAGSATMILDLVNNNLDFAIAYSGLSGSLTVAHFHAGPAGSAGPIIQTICGMPPPPIAGQCEGTSGWITGVWNVPPENITALANEGIYINLHTALNEAGEIRGQIMPEVPKT